jgi:membrane protease YdiL (CAAX protease family)
MRLSPYRNPSVWLPGADLFLYPIALILVNGVFVPVAEEFLWRGQAQNRLLRVLPSWAAIGVTAVLFSFKHVLVDASFGRFMALIAFGVICGMLARRKGWHYSAALHILINTISTLAGLFFGII